MSSISGSVPNLLGGISQQPPATRLENTAENQRNAVATVVSGLRKRPPMRFVSFLGAASNTDTTAYYMLKRGEVRSRHVVIQDGVVKVYTLDGVEEPVTITGASYLLSGDSEVNLGFTQVGDTIFIFNRTKITATKAGTDTTFHIAPGLRTTMHVKSAVAGATYGVDKDGVEIVSWKVPDTGASARQIATNLRTLLIGGTVSTGTSFSLGGSGTVHYTAGNVVRVDNVIVVSSTDNLAMTSRPIVGSYKDRARAFTDLAFYDADGHRVQILGDLEDNWDGYYVRFNSDENLWEETYGDGQNEALDPATMPHTLVDNGDGTWTFGPTVWGERVVGDDKTNATPSFVGFSIQSMFLLRDRMCLLSDENFIASQVGVYENFYRTTTTFLRDDDRIDTPVMAPGKPTASLKHAVAFNEALVLFADDSQFRVDIQELSPGNFKVLPTTFYNTSALASPVDLGKNVLFVDDSPGAVWADVREFFVNDVYGVDDSESLTRHVPELIPSGVHQVTTTTSLDMSVVLTRGDRTRAFIYNYYWSPEGRLQSAWNYWDSPGSEFLNATFLDTELHMLVRKEGKLALVRVGLEETLMGDFDGLEILVDLRITEADTVSITYDGQDTHIVLPYDIPEGASVFTVITQDTPEGQRAGTSFRSVDPTSPNTATFEFIDLTDVSLLIGIAYDFRYDLSPLFLRDAEKATIHDGRFQIRYLSFRHHLTSFFDVIVSGKGRAPRKTTCTGRVMGAFTNVAGRVSVSDGTFRVPVMMEGPDMNVSVINDGPYQCRFSSFEWEAAWRPKTRRMNR